MKRRQAYQGKLCPAKIKIIRQSLILILLPLSLISHAQEFENSEEFTITGQVLSAEDTIPLPGAVIMIKNSSTGTNADQHGRFILTTTGSTAELIISSLGYQTQEVSWRNTFTGTLMIYLSPDAKELSEVVVNAGYYTVKDRERTGNIARITADEISKQPVTNPMAAMIGRMPGVNIVQETGVPGGAFSIQIRGRNSLRNDGNAPLYIVNGVPFPAQLGSIIGNAIIKGGNPLSMLNPASIEGIEILKDADATAIYGSRGANGVVLITTKKGKEGKTQFDLNVNYGIGRVSNKMDLLSTSQYLEMRREAFANDKKEPGLRDYDLNETWDPNRYTDWQDVLTGGTAHLTNARFTVSGGSPQTRFLIGTGYSRETTVIPGGFADRKTNVDFNINHRSPTDRFSINFSGNYLVDNNNLLRIDPSRTALTLPPNAPAIYDEAGNLNWEDGTWQNPLASFEQSFKARTGNLGSNLAVTCKLLEGLQLKASLGYSDIRVSEHSTQPKSSFSPYNFIASSANFAESSISTWIAEPQIEYSRQFGRGMLSALIGATFQESNTRNRVIAASGFPSDALLGNPQAADNITISSVGAARYRYNALYARANYNFRDKYLLNITGRRDGSSRFGPGRQFANFGAVGAAWIFSNEPFAQQNLGFLSFGKLRGSYGITGSDQIGDYGFYDIWNTTTYTYEGQTGLNPANLYNPDFAWEENRKLEISMELDLWNDRLQTTVSYYQNRSGNQLVGFTLPLSTGFGSLQANLPAEAQNTGLEIEVSSVNIEQQDFHWQTSVNLTLPRNKLLSYPEIESSPYRFDYEVGRPLNVQFLYHFTGVDPLTGINTYEDVNDDGAFSAADDYLTLTEVSQRYYGGINNSFKFKGFRLDLFLQFVSQTGRNYRSIFSTAPGRLSNQPRLVMDRWQIEGDDTKIQKFTSGSGQVNTAYTRNSDYTIGDASFIRLKNASLTYDIPASWTRQFKGRIYIMGQNLMTITDFAGLDPESQSASLPPLRMISMGIQLTY